MNEITTKLDNLITILEASNHEKGEYVLNGSKNTFDLYCQENSLFIEATQGMTISHKDYKFKLEILNKEDKEFPLAIATETESLMIVIK